MSHRNEIDEGGGEGVCGNPRAIFPICQQKYQCLLFAYVIPGKCPSKWLLREAWPHREGGRGHMCALVIDIDRPSSSVLPPVPPSVPRLSADFPFGHVVGVVRSAANALQCPIRRPHPSPSLRGGRSKGRNCSLSTNLKASSGDRLQARSPPAQRADGAQHGDGGRAIHARHALSWSVVAVNYTRMRWRPF